MKKLSLLLILITTMQALSGLYRYSLRDIAEMDTIPINQITMLTVEVNRIQKDWIPLFGQLTNLKFADINYYGYNKSGNIKLYASELHKQFESLEYLMSCSYSFSYSFDT